MLTIKGTVREIPRKIGKPPKDGVHRASRKDGLMKGCRSVKLNGELIMPRGMTCFYYRYKPLKGVKIFYSFHHNKICKLRTVKKQFEKHKKLYKLGVANQPHKIVEVRLDFKYYNKQQKYDRHVSTHAYGIVVDHVAYPEDVWAKYAAGINYDFKALDQTEHPNHNPKGYLRFCKRMKGILTKTKIGVCGNWPFDEPENPKLGDGVYDTNKKKWFLVDCGQ